MTNANTKPTEVTAMADPDRVQDIIELEVCLFGGVPERPEPVYERDYHTYYEVRTTRTPIPPIRDRGAVTLQAWDTSKSTSKATR